MLINSHHYMVRDQYAEFFIRLFSQQRSSVNKLFLKILENSLENTCSKVSLLSKTF